MDAPTDWRMRLLAVAVGACALISCRLPQASAQMTPEKPVVYNHITAADSPLDRLAHRQYDVDFKVVDFRDQDGAYSPPEVKYDPRPKTPPDNYGTPITGKVVVFFIITAEGQVVKPVIVSSTDRRLNQEVLGALAQWTFEPARVNGQAVAVVGGHEFDSGATP
jgi:TonB family protein